MFNANLKLNVDVNKEELSTIISNGIFSALTKNGENKKLKDMTLWELSDYLPSEITNEIVSNIEDFIKINIEVESEG